MGVSHGDPGAAPLTVAEKIAVVDQAQRTFGASVAAALWRELGLPGVDHHALLEARFVEQCVLRNTYGRVPAAALHDAYRSWCQAAGCDPLTVNAFSRAMRQLGLERMKSNGGRIVYRHVALRRRTAP